MMKLVVLYTTPADPEAFDRHFFDVHAPLVERVPGLDRWETARLVAAADRGERTYHRIVEMYFADRETLDSGLGSAEGRATGKDFREFAPPGSRLFIATVE